MKNTVQLVAISLLIAAIGALSSNAQTVLQEEAVIVAKNFMLERLVNEQQGYLSNLDAVEVVPVLSGDVRVYYAVNFTDAFVLVAAGRNVMPVLAYSFKSRFSYPEKEENVKAWLGQYERQILFAMEQENAPTPEIMEAWDKYADPDFPDQQRSAFNQLDPLLTSKWNQGKYYNELCPEDPAGPGGRAYAGCVATAMGQVMFYFRHPETGSGEYSYYHPDYDTISANFEQTAYRWHEMVNQVTGSNLAVAELLFHLGVSVDMVYGPNGSGMYNHKAAYSLRNHFKYAPETQYVFRDSTTMDWDSLMIAHLDQRIPMYYAGWSQPHIYGHAFVVDGYQGEGFYHFNWGWGGSFDGYFYTHELTPGGSNFNLAQELIIHCYPDTINYTYPHFCEGHTHLTHHEGTFDDGSGHAHFYAHGSDCTFLIDPQNEMDSISGITLKFDRFQLVEQVDYLNIYDGEDESAPLLASFTGSNIPEPVTSSGNKLFISFQASSDETSRGFFASYSTQKPVWCSGMTTLNSPEGWLSDGSGDFYYNNGLTCMWYINPPGASEVTLNFTQFDTEPVHDKVQIFDPTNNHLLAEFSGFFDPQNLPDPVVAENGQMLIIFTTNSYVRASGWEAHYFTDLTNVDQVESAGQVNLFPNPATGMVKLSWSPELTRPGSIYIYNTTGQLIKVIHPEHDENFIELNVSALASGVYVFALQFDDGMTHIKLIIE